MAKSVHRRVTSLLHEVRPELPRSSVTGSSTLTDDLGFDSLSLMALAVRLHEEIGVDLAELAARAADIRTVDDLIATVDGISHARR